MCENIFYCILCVEGLEGLLKQEKAQGCWFVDGKGSLRMQVLLREPFF